MSLLTRGADVWFFTCDQEVRDAVFSAHATERERLSYNGAVDTWWFSLPFHQRDSIHAAVLLNPNEE